MGGSVRVFLGGTTNETRWRDQLIPLLKAEYFNPVVEDWDAEAQQRELHERDVCDFSLYGLTPKMIGLYSVAEAVDDSNKRPEKTLVVFLPVDDGDVSDESQLRSMKAIEVMVRDNGARTFNTLEEVADFLNNRHLEANCLDDEGAYIGDDDPEDAISMEARKTKKKWSKEPTKKAKWHPPKGLFAEGSSKEIADTVIAASSSRAQAVRRVEFYINRAGKNLSAKDKKRLEKAVELINAHYDKTEKKPEPAKDKKRHASKDW